MKFETEYIEKLANIIAENGLTEISLEDGEQAITIRKDIVVTNSVVSNCSQPSVQVTTPEVSVDNEVKNVEKTTPKGTAITSPMVGTFYKSPSPDADAFVAIGDTVEQGDVVCIVEAMKMMNEIKSEVSGKVIDICVEDGQPVEFGQVLMYIE